MTRLEITVNKVPYRVEVKPFLFNENKRYEVRINGGEKHVFAWDTQLPGLRPLNDEAATLPDDLEREISHRLTRKLNL